MHILLNQYPIISDQIAKKELAIVLDYAEKCLDTDGDFVEFGCYVGTTSLFISRLLTKRSKQLWVYDSFEGLPLKNKQDESAAGFAFEQGKLKASKKQFILNYKKANLGLPNITKGWFNGLSEKNLPKHIAFAFLDGDFYDSIKDSLNLVMPKMTKNSYILVHDYNRETLPGVKKAVLQALQINKAFTVQAVSHNIAIIYKH